jgi:hypothetical protein
MAEVRGWAAISERIGVSQAEHALAETLDRALSLLTERSADDVAVYGSRRKKGEANWSDAFLMADTPGFPDCNTTMWIDAKGKLWLFWPVIIANTWESCITHYRTSSKYDGPGAPTWDWQGVMFLKPLDFEATMLRGMEERAKLFPDASGTAPSSSRGSFRRLTQNVG